MQWVESFGEWQSLKQPRQLSAHRNAGIEVVFVTRGEVQWAHGGDVVTQAANSFTFTWPWQEHGAATERVPAASLYWVVLRTRSDAQARPFRLALHRTLALGRETEARVFKGLRSRERQALRGTPRAAETMRALIGALGAEDPLDRARARHLAALLLMDVAAAEPVSARRDAAPDGRERVRAFLGQLDACCDRAWTLDEMAQEAALGRTRFSQYVAELTGDTPMQILNRKRIEMACAALGSANVSVTEIAHRVGFESSQYFASVFRSFMGETPSMWRRRQLQP